MGGKKPWQNQKDKQDAERPGQKWQLWHGSWRSPQPKPQRPQYDKVVVPWQKERQAQQGWWQSEEEEERDPEAELRREIQRALSTARKADLKVRKLKEDRGLKEAQWRIYEQEAKAEYLKERKRFELALQKIDNEIKEITGSGQEASKQVQELAVHGIAAKKAKEEAGNDQWGALLAAPEAAPEPGFFRDALLAAQQASTLPQASVASSSKDGSMMSAEAAAHLFQATLAQMPPEVRRAMNAATVAMAPTGSYVDHGTQGGMTMPAAPAEPYLPSPSLPATGPGNGPGAGMMTSPGQRPKSGIIGEFSCVAVPPRPASRIPRPPGPPASRVPRPASRVPRPASPRPAPRAPRPAPRAPRPAPRAPRPAPRAPRPAPRAPRPAPRAPPPAPRAPRPASGVASPTSRAPRPASRESP